MRKPLGVRGLKVPWLCVYIFRRRTRVGGRDIAVVRHDGILECIAGRVSLLILAWRHVKEGKLFDGYRHVVR